MRVSASLRRKARVVATPMANSSAERPAKVCLSPYASAAYASASSTRALSGALKPSTSCSEVTLFGAEMETMYCLIN